MVRQLLFYLALGIGSISAFPVGAQDDGATIDVEQVPSKVVTGAGGGERRAASARFLCGRIVPRLEGRVVVDPFQTGGGGVVDPFQPRVRGVIGGRTQSDLVFDPRFPALVREPNLLPGDYLSSITVYNPNGVRITVALRAVATLPLRADGFIDAEEARSERLPPHQGIEIDCSDLADLLLRSDTVRIIIGDPPVTTFVGGVLEAETAGPEVEVIATHTFRPID